MTTVGPVLSDGLFRNSSVLVTAKIFLVLDKEEFQMVVRSLIEGLDDYTIDQRGDVGSWVRISSIRALGGITGFIIPSVLHQWLPQDLYLQIWAGLLKQGAERLDNVRAEVERQLLKLLQLVDSLGADNSWIPRGYELLKKLFMTEYDPILSKSDKLTHIEIVLKQVMGGTNRLGFSLVLYNFFRFKSTGVIYSKA